ncbi:peptide ligase PGM1-related protein [Nocardioides pinisoli]|uniref:Peptide ligase PGM1-related protein n=1 Tax=Nocardioides pinisoli TaxID=2950279 RepID=A0ABT1KZP6_9ACTN|nr:peptide ligase PGM1-related protein [Nocardioides pinisoli]MCP3422799.1 peptide ligase PGM1-related protein [Nocardioides pinisoli]
MDTRMDETAATLADLDEEQRYALFDHFQQHLPEVWNVMRRDRPEESAVVVPSISLERTTASSGTLMQAMEERALFQLLLLRQPMLTLVYVTSSPIADEIVDYYLGLLPGVIPSNARRRLRLVSVGDASTRPLSQKVLDRPRVLRRIRELIPDRSVSHLIPYTTTELERDVAISLGIPMYGSDPRLAPLGSKSGCRRLFAEVGVDAPVGAEGLRTVDDLVTAVAAMRADRPTLAEVIVKTDEGVSGSGNALVDLSGLPVRGDPGEAPALRARIRELRPEAPDLDVDGFLAAFERLGGVVEERITGTALTSPSVQMRVLPDRTVELLSTHDQLLGGASGQQYLGCVFPADPAYSRLITEPAMAVGRDLAQRGVLGRFAVDFVAVRDGADDWTAYAIELNLRKGGTTHPFLTLQFLVGGEYDGDAGLYRTASGAPKFLVATDHLEDDRLKALTPRDVFDVVVRRRLHFDHSHKTGVVFHMLSCVTECGRLGMTAIGDSPEQAWQTYQDATEALLEEAALARVPGTLPT